MTNIFKRLAAAVLVLLLAVSMVACKKEDPNAAAAKKAQKTDAVTVGEHTLSAVELNYFFVDAVSDWYSQNSNYIYYMNFDPKKPLNQQLISETTGETWADSFLETALENIRSTYALYDQAMADETFQLTESEQKALDAVITDMDALIEYYNKLYTSYGYEYPYSNTADYLRSIYGVGATTKNYAEYYRVCTIAAAYYEHYSESLEFDDAALRAYEKDKFGRYSSYSFAVYYVAASAYENADAAKAAADQLVSVRYDDVKAFDEAIAKLPVNAGKDDPTLSTSYDGVLYAKIESSYVKWLAEEGRTRGDMTVIPKEITSGENTTVSGYYVVRFEAADTNEILLKNVRHILIQFEGGTFNSTTGQTTYTDAEKMAAKSEAEKLLMEFRTGAMTELRFSDLANKHSDDGDGTTGGLYEDVYPGQMVSAFNDWCFDPSRNAGDTSLVESEFGWHVMYFVGNTEYTFRDYMITNDLRIETVSAWFDSISKDYKAELVSDELVPMDMVLSK